MRAPGQSHTVVFYINYDGIVLFVMAGQQPQKPLWRVQNHLKSQVTKFACVT